MQAVKASTHIKLHELSMTDSLKDQKTGLFLARCAQTSLWRDRDPVTANLLHNCCDANT
jgi:hypothetical protein